MAGSMLLFSMIESLLSSQLLFSRSQLRFNFAMWQSCRDHMYCVCSRSLCQSFGHVPLQPFWVQGSRI